MCEFGSSREMRFGNEPTFFEAARPRFRQRWFARAKALRRTGATETIVERSFQMKRRTRPTPRLLPAGCVALQTPKGGIRRGELKRSKGAGMRPIPHLGPTKTEAQGSAMPSRVPGQRMAGGQAKRLPHGYSKGPSSEGCLIGQRRLRDRANQGHAVALGSNILWPNPCERSPRGPIS